MFGFVNSSKEQRKLGGEIFQQRQKTQKIIWGITGAVGFLIFNLLLYFISKY
jgi:hypothetical protein